ncbi:RNA pseudouridylate synthase domain-containing protein 2 [Caerostris extrusa]|uniref:RNA pseudouridylate synthase domain-containing protein 2 n=1 Tax=Caerostris extrusa TaxID=172846 RepID=A0AAV4STA1_CAEEX|nr:RNA pseudouridylate synthase domain-containing protein 2 [Caerostris extrusa]
MISRFKKSSKICSLFYRNYEISSSISPGVFTSVLNENDEDLENLRTDDTITEIKNTFDIKRWPYYIENGLQKVYPYNFKHSTYCKGRWVNRTLIDVYSNDFSLFPKEEIERRISTGILKVNGKIVNYDYKLKHSDVLSSEVHRHELPILAWAIEVIFEDDDVLVINKPASMPVHPCGLYRYNSAIFVAEHQLKLKILHVIHRLDRLTSGVIIFAKNRKKSQELHEDMKLGSIKKKNTYAE